MLDLYKVRKLFGWGLYVPLFFFIFCSFTFALNECEAITNQDDVPCLVLLPYDSACNTITLSFYNGSNLLYNTSMSSYSPFMCQAEFNISNSGTYNFQYGTNDTGSIIVKGGSKMIYLLYFLIVVAIILLTVGFAKQDIIFLSLGGFLLMVLGVWIILKGFSDLSNLISDAIGIISLGIGFYIIMRANIEYWG